MCILESHEGWNSHHYRPPGCVLGTVGGCSIRIWSHDFRKSTDRISQVIKQVKYTNWVEEMQNSDQYALLSTFINPGLFSFILFIIVYSYIFICKILFTLILVYCTRPKESLSIGREHKVQITWIWILAPLITNSVSLGKLSHFSVPHFYTYTSGER